MKKGDDFRKAGKNSEAAIEYARAIQEDAGFAEAYEKIGQIYLDEGNGEKAWQAYERAANLAPDNIDLQIKAGGMLLLAHRFEYARLIADRVLNKDPKNVPALVLRANALLGLENIDSAIELVTEAIKLDPGRSDIYSNLASLKATTGELADAEATYKKAIEVAPNDSASYLPIGNFYWATNRLALAEEMFLKALQLDSQNVLVNRALATFYLGSRQALKAEPYMKFVAEKSGAVEHRIALGDYYLVTGRTKEGLAMLEQTAKVPAAEADSRTRIVAATYAAGDREGARKALDALLEKFPDHAPAYLLKARFLLDIGQHDEALRAATKASTLKDGYIDALYLMGQLYAENGDNLQASEAYQKILDANPLARPAQIEMSRVLYARGEIQSSNDILARILQRVPNNVRTRLALVRALLERNDLKNAEPLLKELQKQYPRSVPVNTLAGNLYALKREFPVARRAYEAALAVDPTHVDAVSGLIGLDLEGKNTASAVKRAEAYAEQPANHVEALLLLAQTYVAVGELDRAESTLRRAIDADPAGFEAYTRLGQLLYLRGRLPEGRREFEQVLSRRPGSVGAQTMIAVILRKEGKTDEAVEHYNKVLQIDPNAPIAANNLAWIYAEKGTNLDQAVVLARIAKRRLPDVPDVSDTLGWAYYRNGEPNMLKLAVPLFEEAVAKEPANPIFRYHLGAAYAKSDRVADARRELQKALDLDSKFVGASESKRLLASLQ